MDINTILRKPITGAELKKAIEYPEQRRKPIVESLIYERTSCMFVSQPGVGKSFLALQMALEISAGLPVFGAFASRPARVYYIQKERPLDEIVERIEVMQQAIPWNPDNLIVDSGIQMLSLTNKSNFGIILDRIKKFKPEVLIIDPIGAGTPGLSGDDGGALFASFMTLLENELGTSNILLHHETKPTYDTKGNKIVKDDAFYGSQWIKAYIQCSYAISITEHGRRFTLKKSNSSNTISVFEIAFDAETFLSTATKKSMSYSDIFKHYCMSMLSQNKPFILKEAEAFVGCDTRTLRRLVVTPFNKNNIKRLKNSGKATLYEVLPTYKLA